MLTKKKIINSLISTGNYPLFIEKIIYLTRIKQSSYICISNVHMLMEAYKDRAFNQILNDADIATPDGMPLAKAIKLLYGKDQDRVAGMDLIPDLMRVSEEQTLSIFLYGSTEEVLDRIVSKAKIEFPSLTLTVFSPPFLELSASEKEDIIEKINSTNPDFVFVALGCPKQEKWMAEHKGKINSCMIGLGGAFEVYAGVKERAPKWMQDNSLEWLYRLMQDPKRLWKRYFVTNTLFIMLFFKQLIKVRLFKNND
jgi:N-acetylglucosaminyldiphosphoundecaprenol N-acetyl-beta-D-mannosaminyltransferase